MNRAIAMLLIGLVFGGGLGFVIAAANGVTLDGHDHATDHGQIAADDPHAGHHDSPHVLSAGDAPTIDIDVFADPVSGWNLNIRTTDFTFSPERAGLAHAAGEGHAHVYANGAKLGRVYGDWVHLTLPEGEVELKVTLNANDHRPLAVGDTLIEAVITLDTSSGG